MDKLPAFNLEIAELESRLETIKPAATELLVAVWRALRRGDIPDRGRIDDAAIRLRDALNPNPIETPDWLPDGVED